jgi:putative FmdB family regulatory protein
MPIYTYECDKCGIRFDRRQKFSDPALTDCPDCNGQVRRLIQPAGIVFKGNGWYITDSKRASSASVPNTNKDEPSSTEKSDPKTSDTSDS